MTNHRYETPEMGEVKGNSQFILLGQYLDFFFQQETNECTADPNEPLLRSGHLTGFVQIEGNSMAISFPSTERGTITFSGSFVDGVFDVTSNSFQDFIGDNDVCRVSKSIELIGNFSGDQLSGNFVVTVDISDDAGCDIIPCSDPYLKTGTFTATVS